MDLNGILSRHGGMRLASAADNAAILEFYDRSALQGRSLRLRSERSPDFFRFLKYQSDDARVILHEDGSGRIDGVATIVFRQGYIDGKQHEVAYLGDFRVNFSRTLMRSWRKCYAEIALKLGELGIPAITAVIDENVAAQRAFVESDRWGFRYERLAPYRMVNVLRKLPWGELLAGAKVAKGIVIRRAGAGDLGTLNAFLDRQERPKPFGYCFAAGELERRFRRWENFSLDDFRLAVDDSGRIVGCLAPWSPASAKRNVLDRLPLHFHLYRPWVRLPRVGEPLESVYLTHLNIDRAESSDRRVGIFRALFDSLHADLSTRHWHTLSFCDFESTGFSDALGGYLKQEIPMKLFTVGTASGAAGDATEAKARETSPLSAEPGFEIALV